LLDDSTSPPRLLGKPAREASFMDSTVTGAASDFLAVFGGLLQLRHRGPYRHDSRAGPHIFGVNRMPTGPRGWYMYKRVGADSVNDAGFRMLDKSA
jgi:predicted phage gp36 major capsid-like protein